MTNKCPHCNGDITSLVTAAKKEEAENCVEHASKWIQNMIEEGIDYSVINRAATLTIFAQQVGTKDTPDDIAPPLTNTIDL